MRVTLPQAPKIKKPKNQFRAAAAFKRKVRDAVIWTTGTLMAGASMYAIQTYLEHRHDPKNPEVIARQLTQDAKRSLDSGVVLKRGGKVMHLEHPTYPICDNVQFDLKQDRKGIDKTSKRGNRASCEVEVPYGETGTKKEIVWSSEHDELHTFRVGTLTGPAHGVQFASETSKEMYAKMEGLNEFGSGSPKTDHEKAKVRKAAGEINPDDAKIKAALNRARTNAQIAAAKRTPIP